MTQGNKIKKTLQLSGLHCTACSLVIEGDLEDVGVAARCDWAKQKVEVEYDPKLMSLEKIVAVIEKQGYKLV